MAERVYLKYVSLCPSVWINDGTMNGRMLVWAKLSVNFSNNEPDRALIVNWWEISIGMEMELEYER